MEDSSEFIQFVEGHGQLELASWTVDEDEVTVWIPKRFVVSVGEKAKACGYERVRKNNRRHEYPASITFHRV